MKKLLTIFCIFSLLVTANLSVLAKQHVNRIAQPLASVVIDANTGKVLTGKNSRSLRYPASLTKMMTLYLLFEAMDQGKLTLNSQLKVSRYAYNKFGDALGLMPGDTISVRDAILALAVKSANNVAVVVAESVSGSESDFASKMTKKAGQLGMKNTVFKNASGWFHKDHKTTAYDMALLLKSLHEKYPQYYPYLGKKIFSFGGQQYKNKNRLLGKYPGVDGGKTGYVSKAGYCLAVSAARQHNRIVGVVMGEQSKIARAYHMEKLLDVGFNIKGIRDQ